MIEGVCVSGGKPTLQEDLTDFLQKIKKMGFLVLENFYIMGECPDGNEFINIKRILDD